MSRHCLLESIGTRRLGAAEAHHDGRHGSGHRSKCRSSLRFPVRPDLPGGRQSPPGHGYRHGAGPRWRLHGLDGALHQVQPSRDLTIGQAFPQQCEYVPLTARQLLDCLLDLVEAEGAWDLGLAGEPMVP